MRTKIFWNSMLVGLAVFLLSVGLFMGVLYQHLCGQLTRELETEACLVARGVETMGLDYLEGLSAANRITWVDGDGTVLYDSVADQSAMENHGSREEIREALEGNTGVAVRQSGTLAKTTVYAALASADGTVCRKLDIKFGHSRGHIRHLAGHHAFDMIRRKLLSLPL